MTQIAAPATTDPVVIYDQLLEARNRLLGTFNARESDDNKVVDFALELDARVGAVAIEDLAGQRELREQFAAERAALRA